MKPVTATLIVLVLSLLTHVIRSLPSPYSVNTGVVKAAPSVNNTPLLEQLKALLKD